MRVRLELRLELAQLGPLDEVEVLPLALPARVGLDVNHFGQLAAQQRKGAADVHHADGLVVLIQNEHIRRQHRRKCDGR